MAQSIANKHQSEAERIQTNIEDAHKFWHINRINYKKFRKAIYKTTLSAQDIAVLNDLNKPNLEVNILEAFLSRVLGEWSKQTPGFEVTSEEISPEQNLTLKIMSGYLQAILAEANRNGFSDKILAEAMSGGYSIMKIRLDYKDDNSFEQRPYLEKVLDPTLCGFSPLANEPTKWDSEFAYELVPMLKADIERDYPNADLTKTSFYGSSGGVFNWNYELGGQKIVLVAEYYEKKKHKIRKLKFSNGEVINSKDYDKEAVATEYLLRMEAPPVVLDERTVWETSIEFYRVREGEVLEHDKTEFKSVPFIFVDGNSAYLNDENDQYNANTALQLTRSYFWHALDIQRLKNFSAQSIAGWMQNMMMSKFLVSEQAIPPKYVANWTNIQKTQMLPWNHVDSNGAQIPEPKQLTPSPLPQEVMNTFQAADRAIQTVLGVYDAAQGVTNDNISGKAIIEGALQSNATVQVYFINYLLALTQAGRVIAEVLPKFLPTNKTIPLVNAKGEHEYFDITRPEIQGELNFVLKPNLLNVAVTAGPNFEVQKSRALNTLIQLMGSSPQISDFINSKGLPIIFDNLDIRGQNELKELAEEWQEEMEQAKQEAQRKAQEEPPVDPMEKMVEVEGAKVTAQREKNQNDANIDQQKIEIDKEEIKLKATKAEIENFTKVLKVLVDLAKAETDRTDAATQVITEQMKDEKSLLHDILSTTNIGL